MSKNWLILGALSFGVGFGISFTLERDLRRAAIAGLITLPATATSVAVIEKQRKGQQNDALSLKKYISELEQRELEFNQTLSQLHSQTETLKKQEADLQKAISARNENKQQVETSLNDLQTQFQQLLPQVASQQNRKNELEQVLTTLGKEKQQLDAQLHQLQTEFQDLREQEKELNQNLGLINNQKQEAQTNLESFNSRLSQLSEQIATQENYQLELGQQIAILEPQKHQLETDLSNLLSQLASLENSISSITTQQQEEQNNLRALESEFSQLQQQVGEGQQQKANLDGELADLATQKQRLAKEISQIQEEINRNSGSKTPEKLLPVVNKTSPNQVKRKTGFGLRNSQYTQELWENEILPYWSHRERPSGHRFLGSIRLERSQSDRILGVVGQSLQSLDRVTYDALHREFDESERNWVKILTFALSEYAYYYSSERFWLGFCNSLNIYHNQTVENTLRRIVNEGIDLLGLVRANGGYKYVSSLWLQSGVPQQNLNHFAQLVDEIAQEYGWWKLAHTGAEDLSKLMLELCQGKYSQWGTLIHFLQYSYSEDKQTQPISGQLLQGLALVAQELERQKVSPAALQDESQREELLGDNYLPQNFFLRDWNALINVLTPQTGSNNNRSVVNRRSKSLCLNLDIIDTGNTHLILPEQVLWKREWNDLRETYCQIPEASWEDVIPRRGDLIIPELIIDVNRALENWNCQLLGHNRQELMKWEYKGIDRHFLCLIFDAITGEHLPLNLESLNIIGVEEIICFTPKDVKPELNQGIEVLDNYIPSSIRGWRGRLMKLISPESTIVLTTPQNHQSQLIRWKLRPDDEPILTGLRLKGKKLIYLQAPTFWYPPIDRIISLNILVENITERNIIERTIENLSPNSNWFGINLDRWIKQPGIYEARFWHNQKQWSYRFEIQAQYQITGNPELSQIQIRRKSGLSTANLPIKHENSDSFWSEVIKVDRLWFLEEVILLLSNGKEKITYQLQADSYGVLNINLAAFYDSIPESNWYILDLQRLGFEPIRLLQMQTVAEKITWTWDDRVLYLSGLESNNLYGLSCWNLLLPDRKSVEIKIPLIKQDNTTTAIPLNLPVGIYHIQLMCGQQLLENIGWWCGSERYDTPPEIYEDVPRENYCYTILDPNESKEELIAAINQLKLDFDLQQLQLGISSLSNNNYYFPKWLNADILLGKLKAISNIFAQEIIQVMDTNKPIPEVQKANDRDVWTIKEGNWYLVTIRPKKREVFLKYLDTEIRNSQLQDLIVAIETPQTELYEDIVLVNLSDFQAASVHLKKIQYFQRIERQALKLQQVNQMLGFG